jgi:hypothetical protein
MQRLANPVLLAFLWLSMMGLLAACGEEATPTPPTLPPTVAATPTVHTVRVVQRAPTPTAEPGELGVRTPPTALTETLPALAAHLARVRAVLQEPIPILPLEEGLDDQQKLAQTLALQDARFQAEGRAVDTKVALRSEIFGVYPVSAGDIISATVGCQPGTCYRVEMYNYAYNSTAIGYVDLTKRQVVAVNSSIDAQPDLPPGLVNIAREIAINAPEVVAAWGTKPGAQEAVMAATKTALNKSRCERSHHLCVAPTFVKGEWALWAIVDLTEGTLVGVRWTTVGQVNATTLTEKRLEDEVVSQKYCETTNQVEQDGWQLEYIITSSDGLRILNVRYQGQPVLDSAAVVDWHVSYSMRDGFGYSDAIGCPTFSQAAVVAFNGPTLTPIKTGDEVIGFALTQDFRSEVWPQPCNYYYQNRYEFYRDGSFRPVMINLGRGCGNDGWYRPVLRLALAGNYSFATWDGSTWQPWPTERWQPPAEKFTPEGYQFRVTTATGAGYYLEPARGQFNDGGRGDNPFVYVTRRHPDREEGDADLITIGSCCNNDYQQGPEKFIDATPDSIANAQIVIWYVAQMKNDNSMGSEYCWADSVLENGVYVPKTYPCRAGPMLHPVKAAGG